MNKNKDIEKLYKIIKKNIGKNIKKLKSDIEKI